MQAWVSFYVTRKKPTISTNINMTIFRQIVTRVFSTIKSEVPGASAVGPPLQIEINLFCGNYTFMGNWASNTCDLDS